MQDSQIIRTEYSDIMKKSYIDYAMSVIVARALPDVRDGLKPVSAMINHIENVRVSSGIRWVNTTRMETVPSTNRWS